MHEGFRLPRQICPAHQPASCVRGWPRRRPRACPRYGGSGGRGSPVVRERGARARALLHERGPGNPGLHADVPSVSGAHPTGQVEDSARPAGTDTRDSPAPRRGRLRGSPASPAPRVARCRATRPGRIDGYVSPEGSSPGLRRRHGRFHGMAAARGRERSPRVGCSCCGCGGALVRVCGRVLLPNSSAAQGMGWGGTRPGSRGATRLRSSTPSRSGERVARACDEHAPSRPPVYCGGRAGAVRDDRYRWRTRPSVRAVVRGSGRRTSGRSTGLVEQLRTRPARACGRGYSCERCRLLPVLRARHRHRAADRAHRVCLDRRTPAILVRAGMSYRRCSGGLTVVVDGHPRRGAGYASLPG